MTRSAFRFALLTLCIFAESGCVTPTGLTPAGTPLPGSLKGYELYSWADAEQTWFTLLPGTNRSKTPEEVVAGERDVVDPSGAFAVTFLGLDALGGQLARLPRSASVLVSTVRFPPGTTLERVDTPEAVAHALRIKATALGLDLQLVR